jgi:hypothetical protein
MEYHLQLLALAGRRGVSRRSRLTLTVRPGEGNQYVVRVEIGVLGGGGQTKESSYRTMSEAVDYLRHVVTAQLENGFKLVTVDRRHPLREWLDSEQVRDTVSESPRQKPKQEQKAEQLTLF